MLFARIRRFFRIRRQEREREIFRFWDGVSERGIDPIRVLRAMMAHETFNAEIHVDAAIAGDPEATGICLAATRELFGVAEWREYAGEQAGLTDKETLSLMFAFAEYMDGLKKNFNGSPTSQELTEREQLERLRTKHESAFGSTSPGPKTADPPACSMP